MYELKDSETKQKLLQFQRDWMNTVRWAARWYALRVLVIIGAMMTDAFRKIADDTEERKECHKS